MERIEKYRLESENKSLKLRYNRLRDEYLKISELLDNSRDRIHNLRRVNKALKIVFITLTIITCTLIFN